MEKLTFPTNYELIFFINYVMNISANYVSGASFSDDEAIKM